MDDLITCLIVFLVVLITRFSLYKVSKKKKGFNLMMEMQYLVNRFKLNKISINSTKVAFLISCLDAIIVSSSLFLTLRLTSNIVLELLIAFVLVIGFIILFNEVFGRILKKKGYDKK